MILAHPEKCVACHLCEGACSFQHEGAFQPAKSRIFVHDFGGRGLGTRYLYEEIDPRCDARPGQRGHLRLRPAHRHLRAHRRALHGHLQEPIVFHNSSANIYRKLLLDDGRIVGAVVIGRAEHVQDLGVVQAMIRRKTDVSRWRQMLHGERINYGMLAYESVRR